MVLGFFRELLQDSKCAGRGYKRPGYISESLSSVVVLFAQGHLTGTLHYSMYYNIVIHCPSLAFVLSVEMSAATTCLCMVACAADILKSTFTTHSHFPSFLLCMCNSVPKNYYEVGVCCHATIIIIMSYAYTIHSKHCSTAVIIIR